eukprot:TRINITY_DN7533_c0_g1_i1.p1 TRINITY_DN7533_c0_g1~~TRINITY_DN7533_c0_g1_i1.p1  ORF type:complete len:517 (+),score=142.57 TRINITY_DN7533_c0_g1_i1:105-1553(+)
MAEAPHSVSPHYDAAGEDDSPTGCSSQRGLLLARHPESTIYSRLSKKSSDHRSATCPRAERVSTTFVFVSTFKFLAGLGLLSVAKAMADIGLAGFLIVNCFFALLSWAGCHLLCRALDLVGREDTNAAELGDIALGTFGYCLAFGSIFLDNWGAVVAYWKAMAGTVQNVLRDHRAVGHDVPQLTSTWFLTLVFAVVVGPLVAYRRIGQLGWVMHLGNVSIVIFLVAISIEAAVVSNRGLTDLAEVKFDLDAVKAATVIAYAYDCQVNLYFSYRDHEATVGHKGMKLSKASGGAMAAMMTTLNVIALAGCSAFASSSEVDDSSTTLGIDSNILNNMSFWLMGVQLVMVISIIPCVPLLCFENVAMLQDQCLSQWSPRASNVIGSLIMVVTTALVAAVVPGLFTVLAYMGATTSMCQITIIPPLFYLATVWRTYHCEDGMPDRDPDAGPLAKYPARWEIAMAVGCLVFGLLAVPFGLWVTVKTT